jgi:ureidoacrylate peracid hydrolase
LDNEKANLLRSFHCLHSLNHHCYDVAIISDATASGDKRHYETTLERVRDYYGLVMDSERFKKAIGKLNKVRKGEIDVRKMPEEQVEAFLGEFNLIDPRKFPTELATLRKG